MTVTKDLPREEGIDLWTRGPMSCRCLRMGPDHIVISLFSKGLVIDTRTFPTEDEATDYATHLMRVYGAR